jgi:hypothetical protein
MGNQQQSSQPTKKVTPTELQTYIMVVQAKLTQNRNKKVEIIKKKRKEIAACLQDNNLDIAKAKMESLLREEDFITVFDILGPLCEILKEKVTYMLMSDKCPDDLRAIVDSLVFASTRLEIDELHKIRALVGNRYGELYITKANSNADQLVNVNVVEKLKIKPASDQYLVARLKQLCREEKIEFDFPQEIIAPIVDSFEPIKNPQGTAFEDQFKNYTDMSGFSNNSSNQNMNMNYGQNFNTMGEPQNFGGQGYNQINPNSNNQFNYQQSFNPGNYNLNQNQNQNFNLNHQSFQPNAQNFNYNQQNFQPHPQNFSQPNFSNNPSFSQPGSSGFGSNLNNSTSQSKNMNLNMNEFVTGGGPNTNPNLQINPSNKGFPTESVIFPGPNLQTQFGNPDLGTSYNNNSPTISKNNFGDSLYEKSNPNNINPNNQSSYNPYRDDFSDIKPQNSMGSSFQRGSVQNKVYTNDHNSTPSGGDEVSFPKVQQSSMGTVDDLFPRPKGGNNDFPTAK